MTYSIVARDPASGALGVAVQSCFLGVDAIVPFTRPGVGAVATQAFTDAAYGPRCLDALAAGASAAEALDKAAAADPAAFLRRVGVVWPATRPGRSSSGASPPAACSACRRGRRSTP